ncbi:serine/threonine protein kinase [Coprinopsis cinerea AmutBmut pab1-1]|nr:serine/threonine protein kinase [Coprinopsis cinerea AmutBmut pab1-1]
MPISDSWPDLEASLEQLDEPTAKRITSLHDHLLPHSTEISAYATSLHPQNLPSRLITSTYTWGQSFLVYEIVFERPDDESTVDESWVARFGLPPYEGDEFFNTPEQLERKILNEVGALKVVKERTTVPVPTIYGYCARHGDGFQRKFGGGVTVDSATRKPHPLGEAFPAFILMSALRGKTIEECGIPIHELGGHWDVEPASPDECPHFTSPILKNYLTSLANIHMQLSQITFPQIGSFTMDDVTGEVRIGPMAEFGLGPFDTAEEYYGTLAEAFKRIAEASEEEEDEEEGDVALTMEEDESKTVTLSSAQVKSLRRMFTAAIFPLALGPHVSSSNDRGPFPLRHGDLHSENILVDEETGNIVGVIDWEGAGTVPWEVAGGLNWEVQGDGNAELTKCASNAPSIRRPEIHAAFNRTLKQLEQGLDSDEKLQATTTTTTTFDQGQKKLESPVSRPKHLSLDRAIEDPPTRISVPGSPANVLSPYASAISLSSSSSSSSSSSDHDFDSMKSHSRSSSSSKSNLTAFTSPPTSPSSSIFDLSARKEQEMHKEADTPLVAPAPRLPSISILNTPPSPQSCKTANGLSTADNASEQISLTTKFSRAASEPGNTAGPCGTTQGPTDPPHSQHTRSMVNKSELSLSMAAMSIRSHSPTLNVTGNPKRNSLTLTPTWGQSSVIRSPPTPSSFPRHRNSLHRRKQSSIVLSSLPPLTPVSPSPGQHSPAIPFNLYGPPLHAPPPLLAGSLSLPPLPIRRHGSPSPSPSPTPGKSRSPSPLATPQGTPSITSHHSHHFREHSFGGFPRTPPANFHHGFGHGHVRSVSTSHGTTQHGSYFLPPSLSRSVSASHSSRGTITPSTSVPSTPSTAVGPSAPPPVLSPPTLSSSPQPMDEAPPAPPSSTEKASKQAEPPSPVVQATKLKPVTSPAGSTLSDLHGSVGAYVASYLAHWMFVFGCDYQTVGKALWDVVLYANLKDDEEGAVDVEDAFWVWVKQTLGNNADEDDAIQEEEEEVTKEVSPAKEAQTPAKETTFVLEAMTQAAQDSDPPGNRVLTDGIVGKKEIDALD